MVILKHLLKIVGDQVPGILSGFIFHITIETLVYGCILVSKDGIVHRHRSTGLFVAEAGFKAKNFLVPLSLMVHRTDGNNGLNCPHRERTSLSVS